MMPELGSKSVVRTDLTKADDLESREGGGGGYSRCKFLHEIQFLTEKVTPSYTVHRKEHSFTCMQYALTSPKMSYRKIVLPKAGQPENSHTITKVRSRYQKRKQKPSLASSPNGTKRGTGFHTYFIPKQLKNYTLLGSAYLNNLSTQGSTPGHPGNYEN